MVNKFKHKVMVKKDFNIKWRRLSLVIVVAPLYQKWHTTMDVIRGVLKSSHSIKRKSLLHGHKRCI
ncbi:MAG TPA: hypothetical protein VD815_02060 [Candidatus Saccharimonadales bacterium]|nr:hypothetical protein [Candidatus Saccharimonadales bacterium]